MGIAEYHARAALAASQVIAGFDPELFRKTLEETIVGVGVSSEAAMSNEGKVLAELTVRLLARLYPRLEIRIESPDLAGRLISLAQAINPLIEITNGATIGISIGIEPPIFPTTYFAGSCGWDALLSTKSSLRTGSSHNPLGASAAACLAAANTFNRVLMPDWELRSMGELVFSTFSREKANTPDDVPNAEWRLDGDAVLVGAGAIGNGAIWALAMSPLQGTVHIIDPETLELSNLQRYVLATRVDEGRPKVDLAESYFHGPLKPLPHQGNWAQFVEEEGYEWPNAIVALDTASDRRAVQASLPRWVANSWTQPGDLGVSVHNRFDGPGACLSCLYLPTKQLPNQDELIAQSLGIPGLVREVRTLLHIGEGVSRQLIEAIALGLNRPIQDVLPFEGRPIRELYVEGVCGGALISLGSIGASTQELHVPLAHQSALAGVLLAAALVRRSVTADEEGTTITRIDILGGLNDYLTQPALKAGNGLCICEDRDYVTTFQRKYLSTAGGTDRPYGSPYKES
jgi:hypothetical protein